MTETEAYQMANAANLVPFANEAEVRRQLVPLKPRQLTMKGDQDVLF